MSKTIGFIFLSVISITCFSQPSNDAYTTAMDVSSLINTCSSDALYTNVNATADKSAPSCWNTSPDRNVWFKFQATSEQINVTVDRGDTKGDIRRVNLALYDTDTSSVLSCNRYVNNDDDVTVGHVGLTIGQWYFIAIDNNYGAYNGTFTLCLDDHVDFDYFEGATDISAYINSCTPDAGYTTLGATPDQNAGSNWNTSPDYNRWFKFQATTSSINVTAQRGTSGDIRRINLALWDSTGTNELGSNRYVNNDDDVTVGYNLLTVGDWYYISVDNNYSGYRGSFQLCLDDEVDYDYYEGAVDVTSIINDCSVQEAYTTLGATGDLNAASTWNTSPNYNRWFKFQASTFSINLTVKRGASDGDIRRVNVALWEENGTTEITSNRYVNNDDNVIIGSTNLVPGSWYYISVDNNYSGYRGTFTLCLDDQVDYDYFEGAALITNLDDWSSEDAAYTTIGATGDLNAASTWNTSPNYNRWFKFQATTNQINIIARRGGSYGDIRRINLALWEDDGTTEIVSNRYVNNDDDVSISATSLTPGDWYYFAVDNNYSGYRGTFSLYVSDTPDYDFYEGAVEISDINNWCSSDAEYTTIGATADKNAASCWNTSPNYNRWFKFQATSDGIQVTAKRGGSFGDIRRLNVAVWESDGTTEVACNRYVNNDDNVTVDATGLTPGNWYYISIDNNYSGYRGTFTLCVDNQPSYDFYAGAIEIANVDNYCSADAEYTTIGATSDLNAASCWNTSPNYNRWFKFKAIYDTVTIDIKKQGSEGTVRRLNVALWESDGTTEVACARYSGNDDDIQIKQGELTEGSWYYVSVDNNYSGYRGTFTFCLNNVSDEQYYAIADGDWNTTSTWSKSPGGPAASSVPGSSNKVTIQGYEVTVSDSVNAATVDVIIEDDSTSLSIDGSSAQLVINGDLTFQNNGFNLGGSITMTNQGELYVGNDFTVTRTGGANTMLLNVETNSLLDVSNDLTWTSGGGTVFENEFAITGSVQIDLDLNLDYDAGMKVKTSLSSSGNLNVDRDIYFDTDTQNTTEIELNNTSSINLGRDIVRNGTPYGRIVSNDNSTITLDGDEYLQILAANAGSGTDSLTYQNITFNNTRVTSPQISLVGNVNVPGTLTMTSGNLSTGTDTLTLGTSTSFLGTLSHTSGTIVGNFKKWVNASTTTDYYLPIGTNSYLRPVWLSFNDLPSGSVIASFQSSDPGSSGLPLVDDANTYYDNYESGYWKVDTDDGLSTSDYDVDVEANGFTEYPITSDTRLFVREDDTSDWIIDGTYVTASGDTLGRTSVTTLAAEFGVVDNSCVEATSSISGEDKVPEFTENEEYFVESLSGYTYTWVVVGGTIDSGDGTNIIEVDWGAASAGRVKVVGKYNGCSADSVFLDVTVFTTIISDGAGGGSWDDSGSWNGGEIPGSINDVEIQLGDVITMNSDVTVSDLTINGTLDQNGFVLTVTGDYTINGTHNSSGDDKLLLTGNKTNIDGTGTMAVGGRFQITTGNKFILSSANINVTSGNLYIDSDLSVANSGTFTISGEIQGANSNSTLENAANSVLYAGGAASNAILSTGKLKAFANNNTVYYTRSGTQNVKVPVNGEYYDLVLQSTNSNLSGNVTVLGDLETNNTFDPSGYNFNLEGSWTNNGTFVPGTTILTLSGTSSQTIQGTLYGLVINKSLGKVNLSDNLTITNSLDLTDGNLDLGSFDLIIQNSASAAVINGSSASYIETDGTGQVTWSVAASNSMVFPIGDNNDYSPFTFTLNSGTLASPTVSLRVVDAVHPNIYGSNYLSRYWELTESGITNPDYNVSYVYKEADVVGTDVGLFAAKYSASDWTSGGSVNDDTNTVSWNNITSFSDFTGAQNSIILPIELRELNVKEDAHGVLISWSTYTETNNDYFTIERSRDGKATEAIAEVTGSGTTKSARAYQTRDNSPLAGLSFYRLKQTDFDGQFSHSKWVSFENIDEDHVRFSIFPNPSSGKEIDLTLNYLTNVPLSIRITDLSGQTILQELFTPLEEHSKLRVRFVKRLDPGIYLIQLDGAEISRVQKLIVQ